ncbi:hypothetical protein [Polaromonas sp.]|uniref:hypothetical protein n=1 Tax=Polaromonas sp. TaxID=1869339 RepID=UPI0013BA49B4|nr:hypothetical protein [Polaromonas sp.]NDP62046.1 hypothetical protein [Polaromonas sp.]
MLVHHGPHQKSSHRPDRASGAADQEQGGNAISAEYAMFLIAACAVQTIGMLAFAVPPDLGLIAAAVMAIGLWVMARRQHGEFRS